MSAHDFIDSVRQHFDALADSMLGSLQGDEAVTLNLSAEETLFVRFNANRVRQNTNVAQITVAMQLQGAGRTTEMSRTLSGNLDTDKRAMQQMLSCAREELAVLPLDPHQVPIEDHGSSDETFRGQLLAPDTVVDAVVGSAVGIDPVSYTHLTLPTSDLV